MVSHRSESGSSYFERTLLEVGEMLSVGQERDYKRPRSSLLVLHQGFQT